MQGRLFKKQEKACFFLPWSFSQGDRLGNSSVVQWLGIHASTAGGPGLIPGRGTKLPQATWYAPLQRKGGQSVFYFLSNVALPEARGIWGWGEWEAEPLVPGRQQEVGLH